VVGGSLSNGGNLYAWLLRTLHVEEAGLEARLRRMRPGAGRACVPAPAGRRAQPRLRPARDRCDSPGLTLATTPEDIVHAGLEAVALTFAGVDVALDETVPGARRLVASGAALLSSRAWVQMMADAIGKPVAVSRSAMEASSVGAAALALERLGMPRRTPAARVVTLNRGEQTRAEYAEARRRQGWLYTTLIQGSS